MGVINFITTFFGAIKPFIIGFFVAYILSVPCSFLENKFKAKLSEKYSVWISVGIVEVCLFVILGLSLLVFVPLCVESINKLISNLPQYLTTLREWIRCQFGDVVLLNHLYVSKLTEDAFSVLQENVSTDTQALFNQIYSSLTKVGNQVVDIIIVLVTNIFILLDRHKLSSSIKLIIATFKPEKSEKIAESIVKINHVFRQFVVGKTIDSCIIGLLTLILFLCFRIPYAIFASVTIGITNMIPIVGPIIGAIPGLLLILGESPVKALWYVIMVFIIQQLDGHIIGPKCIGSATGLSTLWVLFAVFIGGKLFGILGMFFGVPVFAVFYDSFKEYINNKANTKQVKKALEDEIKIDIE